VRVPSGRWSAGTFDVDADIKIGVDGNTELVNALDS
jgi:hypothetical protein